VAAARCRHHAPPPHAPRPPRPQVAAELLFTWPLIRWLYGCRLANLWLATWHAARAWCGGRRGGGRAGLPGRLLLGGRRWGRNVGVSPPPLITAAFLCCTAPHRRRFVLAACLLPDALQTRAMQPLSWVWWARQLAARLQGGHGGGGAGGGGGDEAAGARRADTARAQAQRCGRGARGRVGEGGKPTDRLMLTLTAVARQSHAASPAPVTRHPARYQELRDYYEHAATRALSEAGLPVSRLRLPSEQRWPTALSVPDCVDDLEPDAVPRGFVCPITQVGTGGRRVDSRRGSGRRSARGQHARDSRRTACSCSMHTPTLRNHPPHPRPRPPDGHAPARAADQRGDRDAGDIRADGDPKLAGQQQVGAPGGFGAVHGGGVLGRVPKRVHWLARLR
jgi:hypothetical protein